MKNIFVYLVAVILAAAIAGGLWFGYNNSIKTEDTVDNAKVQRTTTARTLADVVKNTEQVDRSSTYIIGLDDTLVPISFKDAKGDFIGFDVDLLEEMAKVSGIKLQFKVIKYSNLEKLLSSNAVDAVLNVYITDGKKSFADFSTSYLQDGPVVVVRRSSDITSEKDLVDMVVGGPKNTVLSESAINYKNADGLGFGRFVGYKDGTSALVDMLKGNLNAVVMENVVAKYYSKNSPGKFRIIENVFPKYEVAMVMRKGNVRVKSVLDKSMKEIKDNGTYKKIYSKWFGK